MRRRNYRAGLRRHWITLCHGIKKKYSWCTNSAPYTATHKVIDSKQNINLIIDAFKVETQINKYEYKLIPIM